MEITLFFLGHWYFSLFSQSFFLHRYSAHKMFSLSRFWERFFYLFSFLSQGSSFLNPRAYAIMHRMHHAFSDTEKDPHSPRFFKDVFSMMGQTYKIYVGYLSGKTRAASEFMGSFPEWSLLDKLSTNWIVRISWGIGYFVFYYFFATEWWMYLLLPLYFIMGPIHGAIVNWCGHKYGYANFDNRDNSRNTMFWDVFLLGELFQNNHHKYPNRANFAVRWFEWDPTFPIMKFLHWTHIIRLRKTDNAVAAAKPRQPL
ncbi:MAG: acyl-CoA desaturase [Bacteroidetes bacterium]|nr:acyl-CoA desaturase [Bacteroidota bacterium]